MNTKTDNQTAAQGQKLAQGEADMIDRAISDTDESEAAMFTAAPEAPTRPLAPNKAQPQQWYGAFDQSGNLRATFDSPSEAYHYTQNRGHMYGGSDKPIVNHADKLAEALRGVQWKIQVYGSHWEPSQAEREAIANTLAAYEAAQ